MLSEEVLANASSLQSYLNSFGPSCEPLHTFPSNRNGYYNWMYDISSAEDSTRISFSDSRAGYSGATMKKETLVSANGDRNEITLVKQTPKPMCAQPCEMEAYKKIIQELTPLGIFTKKPKSDYLPDYDLPRNEVASITEMNFDFSKPGLAAELDALTQKRAGGPVYTQSGNHSLVNILNFRDQTYANDRAKETYKEDFNQLSFEGIEKSLIADRFNQPSGYSGMIRGGRLEANILKR